MVYKFRLLLGLTTPAPGYSHPAYAAVLTDGLTVSELLPKDNAIDVYNTSFLYVA